MIDYNKKRGYFSPLFDRRSYTNIIYLLLSFPLGLIYFIGLTVGLSLGFGLLIVIVGIPILVGVLVASWVAVGLERILANTLLETNIPLMPILQDDGRSWRDRLFSMTSWKGVIYLFAKFPFGIFGFVLGILTLTLPFGLMATPLYYATVDYSIVGWQINTIAEAIIGSVIGVLIAPIMLSITNRITNGWAQFVVTMLSGNTADSSYEKRKHGSRRYVEVGPHRREMEYQPDTFVSADFHDEPVKPKRLLEDTPTTVDEGRFITPELQRQRKTLAELLNDEE